MESLITDNADTGVEWTDPRLTHTVESLRIP